MNVIKNYEGKILNIIIEGRIDTTTAPELDKEIQDSINGVEMLALDFKSVEYISSAGLRVLLRAQKTMNKQGKMEIFGANESVKEVFDITGFSDILTLR